jgi:four helix bundle protein
MNADEMKQRTRKFALRAIKLVRALPRDPAGRVLGGQLMRSATSVAANYRAACRARSKAEFAAKIGTVLEEADESELWIDLIVSDGMLPRRKCDELLNEANELTAIFAATRKTALGNRAAAKQSEI